MRESTGDAETFAAERPTAPFDAYRALFDEEPVVRRPPAPRRRSFPRLTGGQLARAALLIVVGFGVMHIPHGAKARADLDAVAGPGSVRK